ncbi:MAG TPA: hypothetical protein VKS81_10330, partial [Bacteroidota bacterium]|nr:hypothetical protein [Bacteroidota bacterium]
MNSFDKTLFVFRYLVLALIFASTLSFASEPYWQQYVHYTIAAALHPDPNTITGSESLVYKNNSPDTLKEVYFRLYWNLFTKGSHGQQFARRNKDYSFDVSGGVTVKSFTIGAGKDTVTPAYTIDNTLMRIPLPKALAPGDSIAFACSWEENIPDGDNGRSGHDGRDYNMGQWYPQISTYDKYGWDKNQFLGPAEFHDEYGTFDVQVTAPKSFLLGYSGVLLNPEDVYSDSIRTRLKDSFGKDSTTRIADFSNKEWKDADTAGVTWKFHAENVRDFAW